MKVAGIEIDSGSLRVLVLEGSGDSARVKLARELPAQGTESMKGLPEDPVAALSASVQFLREVRLPFASDAQVQEVLPFEVEAYLPRPAEEMALGWSRIESRSEEKAYLAVAVSKDTLRETMGSLGKQGVEPAFLTADWLALTHAWEDLDGKECVLLAHLAESKTLLVGWDGRSVAFAHLLQWGAGKGAAAAGPDAHPLELFADRLSIEIRRFAGVAGWAAGPAEIRLSGVGHEQVGALLAGRLGEVPVRIWPPPAAAQEPVGPQFAIAYGLARMGGSGRRIPVNFLKGEFAPRKRWERYAGTLLTVELCLALALGIFAFGTWSRLRQDREAYRNILAWQEYVLADYFPDRTLEDPTQALPFLQERKKEYAGVSAGPGKAGTLVSAWDLFLEFCRRIPEGMPLQIEDLRIAQTEIHLQRGVTRREGPHTGPEWAQQLAEQCGKSELFQMRTPGTTKTTSEAGTEISGFILTVGDGRRQ